jgi:hypothetical protein
LGYTWGAQEAVKKQWWRKQLQAHEQNIELFREGQQAQS